MIATMFEKVEIRFWDTFLPLLTKSAFVQKIVKAVVSFTKEPQKMRQVALLAMVACFGFATGLLIFSIKLIF